MLVLCESRDVVCSLYSLTVNSHCLITLFSNSSCRSPKAQSHANLTVLFTNLASVRTSNRPTVQTHAIVNLYQVVHLFVLTDCSLSFS